MEAEEADEEADAELEEDEPSDESAEEAPKATVKKPARTKITATEKAVEVAESDADDDAASIPKRRGRPPKSTKAVEKAVSKAKVVKSPSKVKSPKSRTNTSKAGSKSKSAPADPSVDTWSNYEVMPSDEDAKAVEKPLKAKATKSKLTKAAKHAEALLVATTLAEPSTGTWSDYEVMPSDDDDFDAGHLWQSSPEARSPLQDLAQKLHHLNVLSSSPPPIPNKRRRSTEPIVISDTSFETSAPMPPKPSALTNLADQIISLDDGPNPALAPLPTTSSPSKRRKAAAKPLTKPKSPLLYTSAAVSQYIEISSD